MLHCLSHMNEAEEIFKGHVNLEKFSAGSIVLNMKMTMHRVRHTQVAQMCKVLCLAAMCPKHLLE